MRRSCTASRARSLSAKAVTLIGQRFTFAKRSKLPRRSRARPLSSGASPVLRAYTASKTAQEKRRPGFPKHWPSSPKGSRRRIFKLQARFLRIYGIEVFRQTRLLPFFLTNHDGLDGSRLWVGSHVNAVRRNTSNCSHRHRFVLA